MTTPPVPPPPMPSVPHTPKKPKKAKKPRNSSPLRSAKVVLPLLAVTLGAFGVAGYQVFKPETITVTGIKDSFSYSEIASGPLSTTNKDAVWAINGYDFFKGKNPKSIPVRIGKNTLSIVINKQKVTYDFEVSPGDELFLPPLIEVADELDYDGDGITNAEETELGLLTYTNDSDGDGLFDNVEVLLDLDPLKADSYDTVREYKTDADYDKDSGASLLVSGTGNIANTFLDTVEVSELTDFAIEDTPVVAISTSNETPGQSYKLSFKVERSTGEVTGYAFDPTTKVLTAMDTQVSGNTATFEITDLGKYYVIGNVGDNDEYSPKNQISIVLDNSGSMYTCEYMTAASEDPIDCGTPSEHSNDVDFKRLTLMQSLVSELGTDSISYRVSAFTGDTCEMSEWSGDVATINASIDKLRTECQNFNGTSTADALDDARHHIDTETYGSKVILLLTDGRDTNYSSYSDSSLEAMKEKGIKVFTICLGQCDSAYLQNIAAKTNGKFLSTANADGLLELESLLQQELKSAYVPGEVPGTPNAVTIADSGFQVTRDGFSFPNFASTDSTAGNCLGFSILAKDIYLGNLETSGKHVAGDEEAELVSYSLSKTNLNRLVKDNTYNVKLDNTFVAALERKPGFLTLSKNVPTVASQYRKDLPDAGFLIEKHTGQTPTLLRGLAGSAAENEYSEYETARIQMPTAEVKSAYQDDYDILQLINRNYRVQNQDVLHKIAVNVSGKKPDIFQGGLVSDVVSELNYGSPAHLVVSSSQGAHSVLVTKVFKDAKEAQYYFKLYDNNYPGDENRFAVVTRIAGINLNDAHVFRYDGYTTAIYENKWADQ